MVTGGYPKNWPTCPGCGQPTLDGHLTCGDFRCDEGRERRRAWVVKPKTVYIFPNGNRMIFDAEGEQMPDYQRLDIDESILRRIAAEAQDFFWAAWNGGIDHRVPITAKEFLELSGVKP